MKKSLKITLITGVLIISIAIGLAAWLKQNAQKPYVFLSAAASQQFGALPGEAKHSMTDCYPAGTGKTSCPSVTYIVDKKTCSKASASFTDVTTENNCPTARSSFTFKDKEIKTYIGAGGEGEYWVQVYTEDDL
jgi:hypothetical protein